MKNKTVITLIISTLLILSNTVLASSHLPPKQLSWSFEGIFGYFDKTAIQRGFKVYKEVCQTCHSLKYLSYRDLKKIGFSTEEIKSIAAEYQTDDKPNDEGVVNKRSATINDMFVPAYPNEQAARSANNGALPPDLSLIIKARPDGANYLYSILTGYANPPKDFQLYSGMYYNPYFTNHQISMPPPLSPGLVTYDNNEAPTIEQMSKDVVSFLHWAAEPEMEHRKLIGIKVMLYLIAFTVIFYLAKKRIWRNVK
ncbi:MAG: cytochrome c1 [Rickettsiales bacterium]|nr:cytochrome c1 [Rickettsiales bacterium]